jgi:hypothetical protein
MVNRILSWAIDAGLWDPLDLDLPIASEPPTSAVIGALTTSAGLRGPSVVPAGVEVGALSTTAAPVGFILWQLTAEALVSSAELQGFALRSVAGAFGPLVTTAQPQPFDGRGLIPLANLETTGELQAFTARPTGIQLSGLITRATLRPLEALPITPFGGLVTSASLLSLTVAISTGSSSVERLASEAQLGTFSLRELNPRGRFSALATAAALGGVRVVQLTPASFPALRPSTLNFTPPQHAIISARMQNGRTVDSLLADEPGGATLDLGFRVIPDASAEAVWASHEAAKGHAQDFLLPPEVLAYADGELAAFLSLEGTRQRWVYRGPPVITAAGIPGYSNVRVQLRSRNAPPINRLPAPVEPPCPAAAFEDPGAPVNCDSSFTPGGSCECATIAGTPSVGQTLTLGPVICTDGEATITDVQWLRNGVPVWAAYGAAQYAPATEPSSDMSLDAPLITDSTGTSYAAFWLGAPHVVAFRSDFSVRWVRSYKADTANFAPTTGIRTRCPRLAIDPQGRLWMAFTRYKQDVFGNSPDHRLRLYVCRLNSDTGRVSQTICHQFRVPTTSGGSAGIAESGITDMVITSGGDFLFCGARRIPSSSLLVASLYRFDGSLAYQWGKLIPGAATESTIARRVVVAAGKAYVAIDSEAGSGGQVPFLAVFDDTGASVGAPVGGTIPDVLVGGGSTSKRLRATSVAVDTAGAIFLSLAADGAAGRESDRRFGAMRLSSSLTATWCRFFDLTGNGSLAIGRSQLTDLQMDGATVCGLGFSAGAAGEASVYVLQLTSAGGMVRLRRLRREGIALQNDAARLGINRSGARVLPIHAGRGHLLTLDPDSAQSGTYDIPGVTPDLVITSLAADVPTAATPTLFTMSAVDEPSRSTLQTDVLGVDSEAPTRDLSMLNLVGITG